LDPLVKPLEETIYEILAGGMVIVSVAYILWFFYDYWQQSEGK
jgi:hypothetical protein